MSLLDSLISHWKLDEESGTRADSHDGNDLTDINMVGFVAGKLGNAADFEASSNQHFTHTDNSRLSIGNSDFTFACWVNVESVNLGSVIILSKGNLGIPDANSEYQLRVFSDKGAIRFRFSVAGGVTATEVVANNLGQVSFGTWYFVVAWYDSTTETVNIQVNNGDVDSAAHTAGVNDGSATFYLGSSDTGNPFDGLIDSVSFWKRVLTADERTQLYNGGDGLDYDEFEDSSSSNSSSSSSQSSSSSSSTSASSQSSSSQSSSSFSSSSFSSSSSGAGQYSPNAVTITVKATICAELTITPANVKCN